MAGNLTDACRRIMRRAVAMSTGTLCVAVIAGVAAGVVAAPAGLPAATSFASALMPSGPAELRSGVPQVEDGEEADLVAVVPVTEEELREGREYIPPEPEPVEAQAAQLSQAPQAQSLGTGQRVEATLSFYYCEHGSSGPVGDGGGFCGHMRNGVVVHEGAAACDVAYLGQRFRIIGDPLEREYYCADTGSAVHGQHRDIWFMNSDQGQQWQAVVGSRATIEILP